MPLNNVGVYYQVVNAILPYEVQTEDGPQINFYESFLPTGGNISYQDNHVYPFVFRPYQNPNMERNRIICMVTIQGNGVDSQWNVAFNANTGGAPPFARLGFEMPGLSYKQKRSNQNTVDQEIVNGENVRISNGWQWYNSNSANASMKRVNYLYMNISAIAFPIRFGLQLNAISNLNDEDVLAIPKIPISVEFVENGTQAVLHQFHKATISYETLWNEFHKDTTDNPNPNIDSTTRFLHIGTINYEPTTPDLIYTDPQDLIIDIPD